MRTPAEDGWNPSRETYSGCWASSLQLEYRSTTVAPCFALMRSISAFQRATLFRTGAPSMPKKSRTLEYTRTRDRSGRLPTTTRACVSDSRAPSSSSSCAEYTLSGTNALKSLTPSQTVTTSGSDSIATGNWSRSASSSSDPLTPRFTRRVLDPSSLANRGTQPSLAGSAAPTPTLSDAPIATYVTPFDSVDARLGRTLANSARPATTRLNNTRTGKVRRLWPFPSRRERISGDMTLVQRVQWRRGCRPDRGRGRDPAR